MPAKILIAIPPAMLEKVDFIAQYEHRTRSDLVREALRRYIGSFDRETRGGAHEIGAHEIGAQVIDFKPLGIIIALFLACAPASAQELKGPILEVMPPPVVGTPLLTIHREDRGTYAERHPIVSFPARKTWALTVKTGRITRLNKIGFVFKKTANAASDAFVSFGQATEKFHPGLQTVGYLGQFVTPWAIGFFKR